MHNKVTRWQNYALAQLPSGTPGGDNDGQDAEC